MKSIYSLFQLPLQLLEKELKEISSLEEQGPSPYLAIHLEMEVEYCKGLVAYLTGNNQELLSIINKIKSMTSDLSEKNLQETLVIILELRLLVREKNLIELQKNILEMENLHSSIHESYLGEYHFVLARVYELFPNYEKAAKNYRQAAVYYQRQGLNKKYLKSLFNAMVHVEYLTGIISLDEYHKMLKLAIQERDRSILGCILQNLSFQLLFSGSYNSALKLCKQSLRVLRYEGESLNYQMVELNLAHLYYLLGYVAELTKLENKLENSKYPEIRAGIGLLKVADFPDNKENYSLGWSWRLQKKISSLPKLSELEDKLMGYLILSPRTRSELIAYLWPILREGEATTDRLKKVLARLKSKRPQAIVYIEPFYKLIINGINKSTFLREDLEVHTPIPIGLELTGDELKVKDILSAGSCSFYELLEKVYGKEGSVDKLTNRLKNLMGRVRKKCPSRLHYREGKYYWV